MPQILEFSFKNVCAYGNKLQVIPFDKKPQLMLIVGENGAGKTTIGNALEFSWYGKTRRRRIKELANRTNGHLETYNKFVSDDGRIVEVARGIDPAHFDLMVDGKPDTKSGKTKIDEYIERELVGLPFEVCTNVMILSINDFKSFVKIKAEDKRKIVDRIFSLDILNKMNAVLKDDLKTAKEDLARIDAVMSGQTSVLQQSEAQLAELVANLSTEAEQRKKELEKQIADADAEMTAVAAAITGLESEISALVSEMNKMLEGAQSEYVQADSDAMTRLNLAEATCDQQIADECRMADDEMKSVLDAYDAQYAESIGKLTEEVDNAAATAKRDLDAKLHVIETRHDNLLKRIEEKRAAAITDAEAACAEETRRAGDEYKENVKSVNIEIEDLSSEYAALQKKQEQQKSNVAMCEARREVLRGKIATHEAGVCPECDTVLTSDEHAHKKDALVAEFAQKNMEMDLHTAGIVAVSEEMSRISAKIDSASARSVKIDNAYFSKTESINAKLSLLKEKIRVAHDDEKYASLQDKNLEISTANTEYADAVNSMSAKKEKLSALAHERDMKKEQAMSKCNSAKAEIRDGHWKALTENKKAIDSQRELTVTAIREKKSAISQEYSSAVSAKRTEEAVLSQKRVGIGARRTLYTQDLAEIEAKLADNATVKSLENMIAEIRQRMVSLMADHADANNRINLCLATQELLTDNGIKKTFMNMVMPAMNATIRRIIDELQYKFNFKFDEDFNAVIEHMGHEISPESLSTGEEKMIDLIVVLAVMELIKMKHPKINVMFLDEVFASLDQNNIERVIRILREFMTKYNMTLFAISHTMMPKEHFDKIITVTNDGMFSDLSIS